MSLTRIFRFCTQISSVRIKSSVHLLYDERIKQERYFITLKNFKTSFKNREKNFLIKLYYSLKFDVVNFMRNNGIQWIKIIKRNKKLQLNVINFLKWMIHSFIEKFYYFSYAYRVSVWVMRVYVAKRIFFNSSSS